MGFFSFSGSSSGKKSKTKKWRSISRSDRTSLGGGSNSSRSASDTTPITVPRRRPPPAIGRNASCLDPEYEYDMPSTPTTTRSSPPPSASIHLGGDGKIPKEELELVLLRLGSDAGKDEVAEVLAEADSDGDGRISLEEWLLQQSHAAEEAVEEELRVAFGFYDVNGDGKISAEELRKVLRTLGDETCSLDDCRRMIRVVDSDGDGFVCFRDFSRMMTTANGQMCW